MSKREYSNYNVLDDDIKNDEVQEIREEVEYKEEQQTKIQEGISQDELVSKVDLDKVEIHKSEEKIEEPLIKQEVTEETNDQAVNQITEGVSKQVSGVTSQDAESDIKKIEKVNNNFFHKDKQANDSTIPEYKKFYQQKERSNLFKWCMRFARTAILVMLSPLWALIALGIALVIGGFLLAIAGFIGTGVFILGVICFISSQVSLSIVALGISIAVTSIAFGGIILIIFSALMKWVIELVRKYKKPRIKAKNKEVI